MTASLPSSPEPVAPATEHAPKFSTTEAESFARELYALSATARELPSERDQNFHLRDESGGEFVLKVANALERRVALEAQNGAMDYVARRDPTVGIPRLLPTVSNDAIGEIDGPDGTHMVRLVTYVPGTPLARVGPHSPALLGAVGRFMARLDMALEGFVHPGAQREFHWDLKHGPVIVRRYQSLVTEPARRRLLDQFLTRFDTEVAPVMADLRFGTIHNDANDNNVIVAREDHAPPAIGIIDFGDMVESCTVFEPAVAATYALLSKPDPVAAAAAVVAGYDEVSPLPATERDLLAVLIPMRLCMSVALSAYQSSRTPSNEYLKISEKPAWEALEYLANVDPEQVNRTFREACADSDGIPRTP